MSTVELIDMIDMIDLTALGPVPAANTAPRFLGSAAVVSARAAAARGFLIHLVACEAQLAERNAGWLREVGRQLEADMPDMSQACDQLACETEALREQLVVLAHRLVARWNWLERQNRLDVATLLEQPMSRAVAELVALHEANVSGETPWVELAAQRPIEQMLAAMVPLAIDLAGFGAGFMSGASELQHDELADAARLFGAREQRARKLSTLLTNLTAADPDRSALTLVAEEQAVVAFTKVLAECAQIGNTLGNTLSRARRRFP